MWLMVLHKPGVGRGEILLGSGGCCFLKSRYAGKGRGGSVFSPLSVPARWFLGQHPGHFNHGPAQLHLMRNSKPREGKGFAQGIQKFGGPAGTMTPVSGPRPVLLKHLGKSFRQLSALCPF